MKTAPHRKPTNTWNRENFTQSQLRDSIAWYREVLKNPAAPVSFRNSLATLERMLAEKIGKNKK